MVDSEIGAGVKPDVNITIERLLSLLSKRWANSKDSNLNPLLSLEHFLSHSAAISILLEDKIALNRDCLGRMILPCLCASFARDISDIQSLLMTVRSQCPQMLWSPWEL